VIACLTKVYRATSFDFLNHLKIKALQIIGVRVKLIKIIAKEKANH
jgi:hypothetical protein